MHQMLPNVPPPQFCNFCACRKDPCTGLLTRDMANFPPGVRRGRRSRMFVDASHLAVSGRPSFLSPLNNRLDHLQISKTNTKQRTTKQQNTIQHRQMTSTCQRQKQDKTRMMQAGRRGCPCTGPSGPPGGQQISELHWYGGHSLSLALISSVLNLLMSSVQVV